MHGSESLANLQKLMGMEASPGDSLLEKLYTKSLEGDLDCGGLLAYGYYSGENITMLNEGRLAFLRTAESKFNLANFMKVNLYTSLGAVKMGLDILMDDEKVKVEKIMGHGGFFKDKRCRTEISGSGSRSTGYGYGYCKRRWCMGDRTSGRRSGR